MRTVVSTTSPGNRLVSADCICCGHSFSVITDDQRARVTHRCPTRASGPTWVLVEPSGRLPTVGRPAGVRLKSASR